MQGENDEVASKIAAGEIEQAKVSDRDRKLLEFAKIITERAAACTAADVQCLRDSGWSDDQIAAAVYVVAMFAFFNRVADAFGLETQGFSRE